VILQLSPPVPVHVVGRGDCLACRTMPSPTRMHWVLGARRGHSVTYKIMAAMASTKATANPAIR
jgi:hypothetical protein